MDDQPAQLAPGCWVLCRQTGIRSLTRCTRRIRRKGNSTHCFYLFWLVWYDYWVSIWDHVDRGFFIYHWKLKITTNPTLCSTAMNKWSKRFLQKGGGSSLQH